MFVDPDVPQLFHQRTKARCGGFAVRGVVLMEPLTEVLVERSSTGAGKGAGVFNFVLVGAEGDVSHTRIVYTKAVYTGIVQVAPGGKEQVKNPIPVE
jgi:hypothetical protein